MMEILSVEQANRLMRIRGYYSQASELVDEKDREIAELLSIINSLESFNTLAQKTCKELHGWTVVLRGFYKESNDKSPTVLQFVVMLKTYDDVTVLNAIKKRFGGRNSLLDGFEIIDYQLHAIDERAFCIGTAIEG